MVNHNGIEAKVVKSKYGTDIRKSQLRHTQDLNYNDLVLMMQRIFQIKASTSILLKYRDSENDWITLANDDDMLFALTEPSLYIEVFTDEDDEDEERFNRSRLRSTSPVKTDSLSEQRTQKHNQQQGYAPPSSVDNASVPSIQPSQQPLAPSPIGQTHPSFGQQSNFGGQINYQQQGYAPPSSVDNAGVPSIQPLQQPLAPPPIGQTPPSFGQQSNFGEQMHYQQQGYAPPSSVDNVSVPSIQPSQQPLAPPPIGQTPPSFGQQSNFGGQMHYQQQGYAPPSSIDNSISASIQPPPQQQQQPHPGQILPPPTSQMQSNFGGQMHYQQQGYAPPNSVDNASVTNIHPSQQPLAPPPIGQAPPPFGQQSAQHNPFSRVARSTTGAPY